MAQGCVDQAAKLGDLPERACVTGTLKIHGHHANAENFRKLAVYGEDALAIRELIASDAAMERPLDSQLPYIEAEVVWAARAEMARTVEDVLARRTRALFLNARAAIRTAGRVAEILARELGRNATWQTQQVEAFNQVANGFVPK